jgi:DNA-binding Xre family transcriptional regulator
MLRHEDSNEPQKGGQKEQAEAKTSKPNEKKGGSKTSKRKQHVGVKATFGNELAHLRSERGLSRPQFVHRLFNTMDEDDPNFAKISEAWIRRLESAQAAKLLSRQTIEALCRALACTPTQRARLLLYADRSVLTNGNDIPSKVAEFLTFVIDILNTEAYAVLEHLMHRREADELNKRELLEITYEAIKLVLEEDQDRACKPHTSAPKRARTTKGVGNETEK